MLDILPREASQNRFGFRCPQAEGGGVFDHLVVLLLNELPVDGAGPDRLQMWICVEGTRRGTREFLCGERLQAWQEVKSQEITKGKGHFALPMTIHILLLD